MGDTHFVFHSEQAGAGPFLHATTCRRRGSPTLNSVNALTSLSTVIVASLQRFRFGAKSQIFGAPSQDLLASVD
jgi:hypothetical protein